jgi:hypothetical protein
MFCWYFVGIFCCCYFFGESLSGVDDTRSKEITPTNYYEIGLRTRFKNNVKILVYKSKLRHLRSWNTKISTHKNKESGGVIKKFKIMMLKII